jgi:hypothetical protein
MHGQAMSSGQFFPVLLSRFFADPGGKILLLKGLNGGCVCKLLLQLNLSAKSSQESSYGRLEGCSGHRELRFVGWRAQ